MASTHYSDAANLLNLMLFELEDDDKKMVGKINAYLNDKRTRLRGLHLLEQIVPSLAPDILIDNASRWMRQCSACFHRADDEEEGVIFMFCKIVTLLLEEAKNNPDVSSGIGGQAVMQLAPVFTEAISWNLLPTLQCLNTLLKMYGGPCGNFRESIRKAVIQELQKKQIDGTAKALAECWARLPQTGGGGKQGENHTQMWSKQCKDTVATAHAILDDLFEGITEYTTWHVTGVSLFTLEAEKSQNEETLVSRIIKLSSQFSNVMKCLQAMLCCDFPVHVAVPLSDLLELCFRCLGVTGERLSGRLTLQKRAVLAVLSVLHTEALISLKSIILGCGKTLLPHGEPIQDVIVQTLKGILQKDPVTGRELPFRDVKTDAYDTLELWLETAGSCCLYRSEVSSYLISELLSDILRTEDKSEKKETLGKKRKKLRNKSHWLSGSDSVLRSKAISVLCTIVYTNTPLLTSQTIKQIQEAALGSLAELQTNNLEESCPYTQGLRELCTALLLSPHPLWPIPSQYASGLLGDVVGRSVSSSLCHPRAMPLDLPILLKDQTNEPEAVEAEKMEALRMSSSCSTQTEGCTDLSRTSEQQDLLEDASMIEDSENEKKRKRDEEVMEETEEEESKKLPKIDHDTQDIRQREEEPKTKKETVFKHQIPEIKAIDSSKKDDKDSKFHKKMNGFSEAPSCDLEEMMSSFVDADPDID